MAFHEKTLQDLDYYRIQNRIAGFCLSQEGFQLIKSRKPTNNILEIDLLKEQAKECSLFLSTSLTNGISGWEPISPILDILKVSGAALDLSSLNTLGNFVLIATKTSTQIQSAAKKIPLPQLNLLCQNIPELSIISNIIYKVIDKSGQLLDLPQLREIKNSIAKLKRELETKIHSYITNPQYKDVLQSDLPVLRTDRQVLAVKANSRGKIKGIIHEVSQTGQTLYIEPEDVVRKNNDIVQEEFKLQAEIKKILKATTEQLAPFYDDIEQARVNMVHLDTCFASAKWGLETKGIYAATCTENQSPMLLQARHPLLEDKAVPIDVVFPENCHVIIITGPNTGGKTVTLKTLALFTMLNQSGFPIPAAEGTRLPICSDVFADIGDSQSLDQSLSTFSGHMKNIAEAVIRADKNSLVLLDELGSGTDPQEGSSIAMAVLDQLIEKGSWVIVTTHHSLLKNYGFTNPSCINASAEFDEDSLAPTYRIRTGIPGESHAMDIALRSGLPENIINKAIGYLEGDQADVSAMIRGLSLKHETLDELQKEFNNKLLELNNKKNKLDQREVELRQKELELTKTDNRESKKFLVESRKKLENLVRELREGEITQQKTKAVKQFIFDLNEAISLEEKIIESKEEEIELEKEEIQKTI
ncbi:MAG: endonuclease MutS2, partial [Spirochaetaceae bacterium]|nr:endonuclease MutS2 [Spirochaetaceae bacterium]